MGVTLTELARISRNPAPNTYDLQGDAKALSPHMDQAGIDTRLRKAAFLANVCQGTWGQALRLTTRLTVLPDTPKRRPRLLYVWPPSVYKRRISATFASVRRALTWLSPNLPWVTPCCAGVTGRKCAGRQQAGTSQRWWR